jgi:hypothetical protein
VNSYGVDKDKPVTPSVVRDAIINCFIQAHIEDAKKAGIDDSNMARLFCEEKVHEAFDQTGGNFDNPTKESLKYAVSYLASFSSIFRDKSIIEKHKSDINQLINLIT